MATEPPDNPCTTPADAVAAIQSGRHPLSSVDLSLRTAEVCEAAVRHDAENLRAVPTSLITPELCALAVRDNGPMLGSIPESLKTEQLCLTAVRHSAHALRSVPESMRTAEIVNVAVGQWGRALTWVPESMRTLELCEKAVAEDGSALEFVPLQLRSRDMCRLAVTYKRRGGADSGLRYAPADANNYWLCAMSVFYHPWSLMHVPPELKCLEICAMAVSRDRYVNSFVPFELQDTPELTERIAKINDAEQTINELKQEVEKAMQPGLNRENTWWDAQEQWERTDQQQALRKPCFAEPWLRKLNWLKSEKDNGTRTWTNLCNWD
jgi:hypothetical protein